MCCSTGTGLALLGPTDEKFTDVTDIYAPISDGAEDKAFVSKSALAVQTCITACLLRLMSAVPKGRQGP